MSRDPVDRWVRRFERRHPKAAKAIHLALVILMFLTFAFGYGLLIWLSR